MSFLPRYVKSADDNVITLNPQKGAQMPEPKRNLYDIGRALARKVQTLPTVKIPEPVADGTRRRQRISRTEDDKRFFMQERGKTELFEKDLRLALDKKDELAEAERERFASEVKSALRSQRKAHLANGVVEDLETYQNMVVELASRIHDPALLEIGIRMLGDIYGTGADDEDA